MNVITQKENLTAMDVLQYQACWFINNIHDNSYTFDLRVLDYSVSHKITFPLIELARKYSEISEIV
jgi:hypothetical protein